MDISPTFNYHLRSQKFFANPTMKEERSCSDVKRRSPYSPIRTQARTRRVPVSPRDRRDPDDARLELSHFNFGRAPTGCPQHPRKNPDIVTLAGGDGTLHVDLTRILREYERLPASPCRCSCSCHGHNEHGGQESRPVVPESQGSGRFAGVSPTRTNANCPSTSSIFTL